jgi:hypothetical protein
MAGSGHKSPLFVHLRAQDIQDASYRSRICQEHGLIERVSWLGRAGIALDLGIKPTTVVTLVQRAYARVNSSTLNELFGLCLASLSQHAGSLSDLTDRSEGGATGN